MKSKPKSLRMTRNYLYFICHLRIYGDNLAKWIEVEWKRSISGTRSMCARVRGMRKSMAPWGKTSSSTGRAGGWGVRGSGRLRQQTVRKGLALNSVDNV